MFTEYVDFEIQIGPLSESRHAVTVSGPGGDASGALVLPTNDLTYQALASRLAALDTDEEMLVELGQLLFGALFQGAIKDVYIRSQSALGPEQGLRLRLNIAPSAAAAITLPWEFLYDPDQGPLTLLDAPIVRYLPQSVHIPTLETTLPLKVLVTGAQTPPQVDVERELNEVVAALSELGQHVQITVEPHLTIGKLQKLLREGFHIWHFVGHGGFGKDGSTGRLFFEDASGDAEPISAMQLGIMFNRSGLRLIVLDACQGGKLATDPFRSMAPALIRAQIPAVVAMQFSVPEEATRAFAGEFYRALAEGFPIDACVTEGRKAVMNASGLHNADWGIPVVYTRAPDGRLFRLPSQPPPAPAAPVPVPIPPPAPRPDAAPPERRTSNLPTMSTELVGRNQDIAAARALIARPDVRLLTLTGPSGTGKTRLAIQIATDLITSFAHGVWLVNLAPIGNSELVLPTVARTLGVKEAGDGPLLETLQDYLRGRETLLVLDNFEQVLAAAPLIAGALRTLPKLKVIVTSRAALRISGEYEFPVSPLALPDLRRMVPLDELAQNPAVALFVERARAIKPSFALNAGNARAVAEICARLDGLPLAIELAAVRTHILAPPALLARLSNRLDLLTGGARDLAARQQTLRGAIAWSYDLLNAAERALFAALAVFAGGATLETIEAIATAISLDPEEVPKTPPAALVSLRNTQFSVLDELASLVDKSLLRQIESTNGAARFVMLETLREYAQERLAASSGAAGLRRRHTEYFLALAEQAELELAGAEQATWLDRLESEHENFRTALGWTIEQGEWQPALRLGSALVRFWWLHGYLSEGKRWLSQALAAAVPYEPSEPALRAKALNAAGVLAWAQNDYAYAQECYLSALDLHRSLGDQLGTVRVLNNVGMVLRALGDYAQSRHFYGESLTLRRELGDRLGAARTLINLGMASLHQVEYVHAQALYEESLQLFRELGNQEGVGIALSNLGEVAFYRNEYTEAQTYYIASVAIQSSLGNKSSLAYCLEGLASVAGIQGQVARAVRLWSAAEALREAIGTPLPPADHQINQRRVAALRAQINSAAWDASWAAGQTLTLEQALADATTISAEPATSSQRAESSTQPISVLPARLRGPRIVLTMPGAVEPLIIVLNHMPITLGRSKQNNIILNDQRISRQHARLSYRKQQIWLTDLHATNGTFVNGARIEECALADGNMLSFGGLEAQFKDD